MAKRPWSWPPEEALVEWERDLRIIGSLKRGPSSMLIRAVRGQRRCIERLTALIAQIEDGPVTVPRRLHAKGGGE